MHVDGIYHVVLMVSTLSCHCMLFTLMQPFQDSKTREIMEVISKVVDAKEETGNEVL